MQEFFMDYGLWLLIGLLVLIGAVFLLSGRKGMDVSSAGTVAQASKEEVPPPPAPVSEPAAIVSAPEPVLKASPAPTVAEPAPQPVSAAPSAGDDLLRLKGVGPKLNALLIDLGVTSYSQIAQWSEADMAAIDAKLGNFKGRPVRDQWVDQAKYLASGDVAGFEAKYGKI